MKNVSTLLPGRRVDRPVCLYFTIRSIRINTPSNEAREAMAS